MIAEEQVLVLERPHEFRLATAADDAAPEAGEALVTPAYVGLCGTDLHIVAGQHPRARLPLVLGHEIVAVATTGRWAGQAVVVDPTFSCGECAACARGDAHVCERLGLIGIDRPGGLASRLRVAEAKLHPVPASLPLPVAALAEPLAVAVHAVGRAGPCLGARVAILGAGPIGLLIAMVARASGAHAVTLVEPAGVRREAAARLGFQATADLEATGAAGWPADIVFDAAGAPAAIRDATRLARPRGVIVLAGVHGQPAAVDLRAVTFAELTLLGTRVYQPSDIEVAIGLLADGVFDVTPLVSRTVELAGVPAALRSLERGESLKVLARCGSQPG
jgi:(R,R)-butanediol dehydrogenase / meso-butanediol dehydrogenase / diacetyl reductase